MQTPDQPARSLHEVDYRDHNHSPLTSITPLAWSDMITFRASYFRFFGSQVSLLAQASTASSSNTHGADGSDPPCPKRFVYAMRAGAAIV